MELLNEQFMASQLYEQPSEEYPVGESHDHYKDDDETMSLSPNKSDDAVAEDFFDVLIQIQSTKGQATDKGTGKMG